MPVKEAKRCREKKGSQGLEKQEKVYPMRFQSPIGVALAGMLFILAIIGTVVANIYADQLAELIRGEPEEPTADPNSSAWRERPF